MGLAINFAIQTTFWVTLVFAIVERTADGAAHLPSSLGIGWDVDQLPDLPKQRGSLSDLIAGLVWLGLIGLAIVWQQVQSPIADGLPLLDPDLWDFWLPLILLLLVAEARLRDRQVPYRPLDVRTGDDQCGARCPVRRAGRLRGSD